MVGILSFIASAQQPYVGVDIERINDRWTVVFSDPNGEGYKAGIRIGDEILKINGEDAGQYRLLAKWGRLEGASGIEFRASGQMAVARITIQASALFVTLFANLSAYLLGFIFWLLGFITWRKRPFLNQVHILFWLNWAIAMAFIFSKPASRSLLLARELEFLTLSLVPLLLVSFISVFPVKNADGVNRAGRYILGSLYVLIFSLTMLQFFDIVHLGNFLRRLVLSNILLGITMTLWNFALITKLPKGSQERNQLEIVLLGLAAGLLPIALLTALPAIMYSRQIVYTEITSLFLMLIPISLYYVIVHKYLPASRRILGAMMSSFAAGAGSFILTYALFFSQTLQKVRSEYLIFVVLAILFIVCFYGARFVINRLIFKQNQALKLKIFELNQQENSLDEERLSYEETIESLGLEGAFLIADQAQMGVHTRAVGRFLEKPEEQAEMERYFQNHRRSILDIQVLAKDFPAEIYIPFAAHGYVCGVFIGHRSSHIRFERAEWSFLTLLASQLAHHMIMSLVIQDMEREMRVWKEASQRMQRKNQGLSALSASLFERIENERRLTAEEIHHGPLKRGRDINRCIRYLLTESPTPEIAETVLEQMQNIVVDLNDGLRLMSGNQNLLVLTNLGLLAAVEVLCQKMMIREETAITLETEGIHHDRRFRKDIELTAYRFIQESLANSLKHSGAAGQTIRIEQREAKLYLWVSDQGRGFDPGQIEDWAITRKHVGIVGIREWIASLKGEVQVCSALQKGTTLTAVIPLTDGLKGQADESKALDWVLLGSCEEL
jgi:two-component system sensor histidine kinase ComP